MTLLKSDSLARGGADLPTYILLLYPKVAVEFVGTFNRACSVHGFQTPVT